MFNVESTIYSIVPDMPVLFVLLVRIAKVLIHSLEFIFSRPPRVLCKFEEPAFGWRRRLQAPFIDKLFLECVVANVEHEAVARVKSRVLTTAMN